MWAHSWDMDNMDVKMYNCRYQNCLRELRHVRAICSSGDWVQSGGSRLLHEPKFAFICIFVVFICFIANENVLKYSHLSRRKN